jgi:hypothetical protein
MNSSPVTSVICCITNLMRRKCTRTKQSVSPNFSICYQLQKMKAWQFWTLSGREKVQQTLHLSLCIFQYNLTLMMAFHQPHASCSLAREYTSISWFSAKSGFPVTPSGGRRTWENGNFDSGCQLKNKNLPITQCTLFITQHSIYSALNDQNACKTRSNIKTQFM